MALLQPMIKDGEKLLVHPTCVNNHSLLGWKVFGELEEEPVPEPEPFAPVEQATAKKSAKDPAGQS